MQDTTIVAIVGQIITLIIAVVTLGVTNRTQIHQPSMQSQKEAYEKLLIAMGSLKSNNDSKEYKDCFTECRTRVLLYASTKLIERLREYERYILDKPAGAVDRSIVESHERSIINEMRNDIRISKGSVPNDVYLYNIR